MKQWYVLKVKPRYERIAAAELCANGFEGFDATYTEKRKWSDRMKRVEVPLFPGYIFCHFMRDERTKVLKTPGVTSLLSFGNVPAVVPEEEIAAVRAVVASGLPARPRPYLVRGDRVTVHDGCLAGVSGIVVRTKGSVRVVVSVTILQRSVEVELGRAMISAGDGATLRHS